MSNPSVPTVRLNRILAASPREVSGRIVPELRMKTSVVEDVLLLRGAAAGHLVFRWSVSLPWLQRTKATARWKRPKSDEEASA